MASKDDGADGGDWETERKMTRRTTPILRWRWRIIGQGGVYHAVQPREQAGGGSYMAPACEMTGHESVLEVDLSERCLECIRVLAKPEP